MNVLDFTIGASGKRLVLTDEGILSEDAVSDIAYQHLPQSQRPLVAWNPIDGPEGVELSRVFAGLHGAILVLGEGRLFERVRDTSMNVGVHYRWQELHPGEPPSNPPVSSRTPSPATFDRSVADTFEAQKRGN